MSGFERPGYTMLLTPIAARAYVRYDVRSARTLLGLPLLAVIGKLQHHAPVVSIYNLTSGREMLQAYRNRRVAQQ